MWVDFDRDGLLDLFVCNYVKWSAEHDVFCSLDGKQKSYCTPEAYRGETCWLFRNRGNGTFEDVTATSGIFDSSSKSLGVALLDYDQDGWPDLFVANDTQPNKLYRNLRNGTFKDVGARGGRGAQRRRQGARRHGRRRRRLRQLRPHRAGRHQLRQRDDRRSTARRRRASTRTSARRAGVGAPSRNRLGFGCVFADLDLDGALDLVVANGHIDDTVRNIRGNVGHAQPPQLFLNQGDGTLPRRRRRRPAPAFAQPRVGRGLACGDFDRDGDVDLLMTTNNGPAVLFRNDQTRRQPQPAVPAASARSRTATRSAPPSASSTAAHRRSRMVKSGSSYLSQSELPVTFGVGRRDRVDRVVITWPSGRTEEFKNVRDGHRPTTASRGRGSPLARHDGVCSIAAGPRQRPGLRRAAAPTRAPARRGRSTCTGLAGWRR